MWLFLFVFFLFLSGYPISNVVRTSGKITLSNCGIDKNLQKDSVEKFLIENVMQT